MDENHRLVDPFTEYMISKLSDNELNKRQYYRPVYSLHKWWARRPGALFRSIVLLDYFRRTSGRLFNPKNLYDSLFYQDHELSDLVVYDPFMGGGTTIVESNRLGARTIGNDLNPVSYWIVKETVEPVDLVRLRGHLDSMDKTVGEEIRSLYKTRCLKCGNTDCDAIHVFWVRVVECLKCGNEIPLFRRSLLNTGLRRGKGVSRLNPATVVCQRCLKLGQYVGRTEYVCPHCKSTSNPREGSFIQGRVKCPRCSAQDMLINMIQKGKKLTQKMFAIEYYCANCRQRAYKEPDSLDLKLYRTIVNRFDSEKETLVFPKQDILAGSSSVRWRAHGFRYYHELFNPRQILAFDKLFPEISRIPDKRVMNALVTVFSNSLEYNNMMVPYNYPHRKLHHLFTHHALPLTTIPVEGNFWGVARIGAGTYTNCFERYYNAKRYCLKPFDRLVADSGRIVTIPSKRETIKGNLVSSYEELLRTDKGVWLLNRDSAKTPMIPAGSVSTVITDPPYAGNIHYSELSNFFYVWLRLLAKHGQFVKEHVPIENEAVVNPKMGKDLEGYLHLLTTIFRECNRVLSNSGSLIFTFHHKDAEAWWAILSAIRASGFLVSDYCPVNSEYKVNPHVRDKYAVKMDLVLFCLKQQEPRTHRDISMTRIQELVNKRFDLLKPDIRTAARLQHHYIGQLLSEACNLDTITYDQFYAFFLQLSKIANEKLGDSRPDGIAARDHAKKIDDFIEPKSEHHE